MKLTSVDCTLCENEFGRYCVPAASQDRPAPMAVLKGKVWEYETVVYMRENIGDRDIVHAGMYFGDFLPGLAKVLRPTRVLYGFEPNPANFACAQWTAVLNDLTNVVLTNSGLGEASKQAKMRVAENGRAIGGLSEILQAPRAGMKDDDVAMVDVVAIDDAIPAIADVGILQLDVEGYEQFALMGAMRTLERCRPIVIVESVPEAFIRTTLLPMGYRRDIELCHNTVFVPV